jgi:transcriptional regulator GlxA family with amidase domain
MPVIKTERTDSSSLAMDWAIKHLNEPLNFEELASRANMSRRSFIRHSKQKTGMTFVLWILYRRLGVAPQLLETGSCSLDDIAERAGFGSTVSFRLQFSKNFSVFPASYRKQFRFKSQPDL